MCKKKFVTLALLGATALAVPAAMAGPQLRPTLPSGTRADAAAAPADPAVLPSPTPGGKPSVAPAADDAAPSGDAASGAPTTIVAAERLPDPISNAVVFEGRDGEITFMSENGRFVLRGTMFDTWSGRIVTSMEDLRATAEGFDPARFGMTEAELEPLTWGTGKAVVSVFVDPYCPYCGQLFAQMRADPGLADHYTFRIYTVAYLGERSSRAVARLTCHPDKREALDRLMAHDTRWLETLQAPECSADAAIKRMMLAQGLGVGGVPFLVGPGGGLSKGIPPDLRTFLESS